MQNWLDGNIAHFLADATLVQQADSRTQTVQIYDDDFPNGPK